MWLSIALGYCVVCWLVGFLLIRSACWSCATAEDTSRTGNAVIQWGVVLFAPLYLPFATIFVGYCVVRGLREQRTFERAARTFRAYEFVKVNYLRLDESIREQFELHTGPLLKMGFDLIGDYRLKPEPIEVHDRFFLSPDGETLAAICALLETGSVCFISVLEDGTCVDTCSAENPDPERTFEPADQTCLSYVVEEPIKVVYAHHVKTLKEVCAKHGTSVMRFQSNQFKEIVTYDQRIQCRVHYRRGDLDNEPPAPDFASLRETPAVASADAKQIATAS